jgi:DNA-nicking Smr family endonuclease
MAAKDGDDLDGDDLDFEEAMADVSRVENDKLRPEPATRKTASLVDREREAQREFDRVVSGEAPFDADPVDPTERIEGKIPGLDPRELGRLRRGDFAIQDELDLHRLGVEDARARLEGFLADAHARGLRCVRVVHGWGRGSPGGVSLIKSNLPRWLARGAARTLVLAYTTAPPNQGGAGATFVLLRGGGPAPRPPRPTGGRKR